jgi:uncharacterized protein YjbJ (UPF0337 family)
LSTFVDAPLAHRVLHLRPQEVVMNEDTLKGQWTQLKGTVREKWGKLTNDDLDQIQGQTEQLVGKIQQRYGIARDDAQKQVDEWNRDPNRTR